MKFERSTRSAALCRAWLDACSAFEDAREVCRQPDLLEMAAYLELVSTSLWAHGSQSCNLAAVHTQEIACLLIVPAVSAAMPRTVLTSELEGAVFDVGDALDNASRAHSDRMVQQIDAITEVLWSRGDDKHARAAIRLQGVAALMIQRGVSV
ncbi:hypothetical protein [Burkholderia pseudomallei]|uniref:hypothetical protein n=1 Tax=Burkholderia pseudomallei TaxID=28450 RepID=UPI002175025C|nr:hypothetical protein [Burkholderia pseudomallei]